MNKHAPEALQRRAEAARWLMELRDAPDDDTVNRWLQWCEQSPANAGAYRDAQTLWRQFDQLEDGSQTIAPRSRARHWVMGMAVAASLLAAVGMWQLSGLQLPVDNGTSAANRTSVLPDGSTLALGGRTTVAMEFSGQRRVLELSPGQAYFKVAPDNKRPFVVKAGALEVTALGTAFDVKRQSDRIIVTVQEGVVSVSPSGQGPAGDPSQPNSWQVSAGYQFVYCAADATTTLSSVDTSAVLAWREGRLEYVHTPLATVLADVSRYAEHTVELAQSGDPALAQLTFTGTVFIDSIEGWITALPGALPVRVERPASGRILVRSTGSSR